MTEKPRASELKRIVESVQDLPTLPPVVTRLLSLVHSPDSSARDVEAVLSRDQSLTMKVMRLVNSPFYGYGNIKSVQQAVVILGFESIRSIALSASVFESFPGKGDDDFDRLEFWRHALAVGTAARILAKIRRWKEIEEAFAAGIVHDIGKVVLDEHLPELWRRVLAHARAKKCLVFQAEREVVGFSHAQIGRWLATKWRLPPRHVAAIFYHHQPAFARDATELVAIVHIADILARRLGLGNGGDDLVPPLDPEGFKRSGLEETDLKHAEAELPEAFEKADIFLQLLDSS